MQWYRVRDTWNSRSVFIKDLGIVVVHNLNLSQPFDAARKKLIEAIASMSQIVFFFLFHTEQASTAVLCLVNLEKVQRVANIQRSRK